MYLYVLYIFLNFIMSIIPTLYFFYLNKIIPLKNIYIDIYIYIYISIESTISLVFTKIYLSTNDKKIHIYIAHYSHRALMRFLEILKRMNVFKSTLLWNQPSGYFVVVHSTI